MLKITVFAPTPTARVIKVIAVNSRARPSLLSTCLSWSLKIAMLQLSLPVELPSQPSCGSPSKDHYVTGRGKVRTLWDGRPPGRSQSHPGPTAEPKSPVPNYAEPVICEQNPRVDRMGGPSVRARNRWFSQLRCIREVCWPRAGKYNRRMPAYAY